MNKRPSTARLIWNIASAHSIAYFVAGIFALVVMNYKDLYATESISLFMRQTSDPVVALGPALQILRGALIALALLPLRKAFFEDKRGYAKLALVVLVLSLLSTIGPTMGSFDGYIYTTIPPLYQLLGYPESLVYVLLFVALLFWLNRSGGKRAPLVASIVLSALIILMGVAGYLGV